MTIKSEIQTPAVAGFPRAGFIQPSRIIIADSDTAFTASLSNYLVAQPGYEVVAKVNSCADALTWCGELTPDILILDWQLMFESFLPAGVNNVPFLRQLKGLKIAPSVIIASRLSLDEHRTTAMQAGADEFMPKSKFPQLIRPIIARLVSQN